MSFFDDDFFSTKVSVPRQPERSWTRSFGPFRWRIGRRLRTPRRPGGEFKPLMLMGGSLLAGIVLTSLAFLALSGGPESVPAAAPAAASSGASSASDPLVHVAETVMPTVVSILSTGSIPGQSGPVQLGLGSGVIFEKTGGQARIVTNSHVVQMAEQLEVVLASGVRKKAKLVGKDMITDLAVLEVDAKGIERVAEFGDSDTLRPGEVAIAIGNPLGLGFSQSITAGIISWPSRKIPISFNNDGMMDWEFEVIQTDAAINHGNSGGALVNLSGKVIGINSMKISETGVEGLGFAIPINAVKTTIDSLIEFGKVKRPFMGVTTIEYRPEMPGVHVLKVPESVKEGLIVLEAIDPSKKADLAANDVIVELDGKPVGTTLALRKYLYGEKAIGDQLEVTYYRAGKKGTATVILGESRREE